MKLTITKDLFLSGLSAAQNVIKGRTTLPILSHVMVTATDGRLTFNATDLDMETKSSIAQFQLVDDKGGETVFITKLIEGQFPNWKQFVPVKSNVKLQMPVAGLMEAARRVRVMTSEKANQIALRFTKGNLTITAQAPDSGEASETLECGYPSGNDIAIAINPLYLIGALSRIPDTEVEVSLIDPLSPFVFRGKDSLIIIMPD